MLGWGGDGERKGGVTNLGFFPSGRGQHRHIQSLTLSHRGTALALIQLRTQTQGAGSWGEFTTEEESFCSERAFKYEIEIPDFMISQGKRVERIQLLTNQACEGAKKRENPWSCSSTDFKPPEPSACVVTETGGEKGPQESLSTETMAPY